MRRAFTLTLPIFMGYLPLGAAFSVTWIQQGLPWWGAVAASVFLYAGSMQFLLVGLLAAGADWGAVLLATLAVNLRHIFYGLSFPAAAFRGRPLALAYAVFSLTDEAWSLSGQIDPHDNWRLILQVHFLCHLYWIGGTLLGIIAGALLPPQVIGFDFALTALFTVLAQNHYAHRRRRPAMALGLIGILTAFAVVHLGVVDEKQTLAVAITVLLGLLFFLPRFRGVT